MTRTTAAATTDDGIDYAAAWKRLADRGTLDCWRPAADRAYWRSHGETYDERFPDDETPEGFDAIRRAADGASTALELGPGTGRYTVRLAERVDRVTAVDYSKPMLEQLRVRLATAGVAGVRRRHGRWPDVDVDGHDLVCTAWTMYSQEDLTAALEALVHATGRTLVIVDSAGASPPHANLLADIRDEAPPSSVPRCRYVAGVLEQLGASPSVHTDDAVRCHDAETPRGIVDRLVPDASAATRRALTDRLDPHLEATSSGVRYRYAVPAGVVVWNRPPDWEPTRPTDRTADTN